MKNKGIALILTMFSLVFISLLVVAFVDMATIDQQIATNHIKDMQAGFLADAGIEHALYKLKSNNSYTTDSGDWDTAVFPDDVNDYDAGILNTGSYKVGIPTGSLPKTVICTGTVGTFNRSLEVVIDRAGSTVRIDNWKEI